MTFTMKPGRHYIALWSGDGAVGNVLCAVFRDNAEDEWTGIFRMRTYVDTKVFGSADPKDWHTRVWPSDTTEDAVEANVDALMERIQRNLADNSYAMKVRKIDLHTDDCKKIISLMSTCPEFHIRTGQGDLSDADWDGAELVAY